MTSPFSSHEETKVWILKFYAMQDSLSTTHIPEWYMPDATLKFANNPEAVGVDNIIQFFTATFSLLESLKHELLHFDVIETRIYHKARVTCVAAGDPEKREIVIAGLVISHLTSEWKINCMEVYVDFSPIMARAMEIKGMIKT